MTGTAFLTDLLGAALKDPKLYERALTHGSFGRDSYERLEFLGDRVLGLAIAEWLFERFPQEPEGQMSRRYNALVARESCAEVGRAIGIPPHIRLGKQAREDQAGNSDNVVGDVVEALLGAMFLEHGVDPARAFIRKYWAPLLESQGRAPTHPKSALQELAAARNLGVPAYELVSRHGPHHAPTFKVRVALGKHGEAEAQGDSKQEAETAAAAALVERLS